MVDSASLTDTAYPRIVKRFAAVAALALAALIAAPTAASAHSDVISTVPEDGAILSEAPTELVFTFSEPLLPDFVRFIATDPAGTTEDLIVTGVDGSVATVSWPAGAGPGTWDVQYRVVSQDGHPVNGGIVFTYGADPSPTPEPTVEPTSSTPTPSPEPTSSSAAQPTPSASASSPAMDAVASTSSNGGWIIAGIAVAVLAVIAVAGVILRSRSS